MNPIIYGKNSLERIVAIEPQSDICNIYCQELDGSIVSHTVPNSYYILYKHQLSPKMTRLKGNQPFKWLYETTDGSKYYNALKRSYEKKEKFFVIRDHKEAFMVRHGYTYYKGLRPDEVTVLSFDLEHSYGVGEVPDPDGELLIISMSYRKNGKLGKRLISLDEVEDEPAMLKIFSQAITDIDPSIILSHNLFGHDFPILRHVAEKYGLDIPIGRDGSPVRFNDKTSLFRKDGSQAYDFYNAFVYGRELVDTYFLALKYDVARNYESYGLKQIIKHEGLEKKGRQYYNAANIKHDWKDLSKRKQIKQYALDDAEDCIKLYDLMATSYFYYTQSVPRSFQQVINSATGSQLNSLMVRAYLQDGHSIAEGDEKEEFVGGISYGNPGIYKNGMKIDFSALYPSIIRQFKIYNQDKDPEGNFLKIVEYAVNERNKDKELFEKTKDPKYDGGQQAKKVIANSCFGLLGAPKLNYNSPSDASKITTIGRELLKYVIYWTSGEKYET